MNREEKIIAYLLGELDPKDEIQFETSLQNDPELQLELDAYKNSLDALDKVGNELPSSHMASNFESFLSSEIEKSSTLKPKIIQLSAIKWMGIAASILLAGFFLNQFMNSDSTLNQVESINPEWMQTVSTGKTSERIQAINEVSQETNLDLNVLEAIKDVVYNDQSSNVRLAAVESLGNYVHQSEVKELLIEALQNIETPIVKIEIINILTQNKDEKAKDTFEAMLTKTDLNDAVRNELHSNIRKLEQIY